jgi:putative DNA primase/helicase
MRTDLGNAELFARFFHDKVRHDHARDRWLLWQEHWWTPDSDGQVVRLAKQIPRIRAEAVPHIADEDDRKRARKFAVSSESQTKIKAAIELAKSERPLAESGNWDSDPWLLGVSNGIIDLKTGALRNGRQSDRITIQSEVRFDPAAECLRWKQFLREVFSHDRELIEFVQRAIGYCLTGDVREQVLFFCYGTGANGKSTFLDVIKHVLGQYALNLPFSAFELKSRQGIPNDIAALEGKRFVTALETNEATQLNEARIKALTGCDPVTARFLYKEWRTFAPTFKIWLAFNHKPEVSDDSFGFWRRVRLIPFERQFSNEDADPKLLAKLKAEAPGILAWAVEGCLKWQAQGLGTPRAVERSTAEYRKQSDSVENFLDSHCKIGNDLRVGSTELHQRFLEWAQANGEAQLNQKTFGERLAARGFTRRPCGHNKVWTWFGLELVGVDPEPSPPAMVRADAGVNSPLLIN